MPERDRGTTVQLKLRMKEPLRAGLADAAEENGVSLNSEIVSRLQRSLTDGAIAERVAPDDLWVIMTTLSDPTKILMEKTGVTTAFDPKCFGDFGAMFIGFFSELKKRFEARGHTIQQTGPSWEMGELMAAYFDDLSRLTATDPNPSDHWRELQAQAWKNTWGTDR